MAPSLESQPILCGVKFAAAALGRLRIISLIAPENRRSIRVAERLGESLDGEVRLPHTPNRSTLQYSLSRDEWQRRR
jgi:RimJ/RimL family protein N-acetyltransferase